MNKREKISLAQKNIAQDWSCDPEIFNQINNVILKTDKSFFDILTFGNNAVIRANEAIYDWCVEQFASEPFADIMDGDSLYSIEKKMREHGYQLAGEHVRYLHLNSEYQPRKPEGFIFETYEKDQMSVLYEDERFDSALNYDSKGEVLAIVARKDDDIAAIVAIDDYNPGFWQIGIDTVDTYRGNGLAAYLVKLITLESEKRNKLPFYVTWSPNISSARTALSAGYLPVWVGYYAEEIEND